MSSRSHSAFALTFGALVWACGSARQPLPAAPAPKPSADLAGWRAPPPLAPTPAVALDWSALRAEIGNGLHATIVARPRSETTVVRLWVPSAADFRHGPVSTMAEALRAGTLRAGTLRAGTQPGSGDLLLNPRLSGSQVSISTDPKGTEFTWHVLPRAAEQAIALLADFVLRPAFDPAEVQARTQQAIRVIQGYSGSTLHQADIARGAIPGLEAPNPERDARRLLRLSAPDMKQIHECTVRPEHAELIIVGPVEPNVTLGWARNAFAAWPTSAVPDSKCAAWAPPRASADREPLHEIEAQLIYGSRDDPYMVLVLPGPPVGSSDFAAFTLLTRAIEQHDSGSMKRLRHTGATYGIQARLNEALPGMSLLEMEGQIDPASAQSAVRDLILDIRGIAKSLTADELESVKRRYETSFVQSTADNRALATWLLWELEQGRPPRDLALWPQIVSQVSLEQCQKVAEKWLSAAQPSLTLSGVPVRLARGFGLDMRVRQLYWTNELSEYKKAQ